MFRILLPVIKQVYNHSLKATCYFTSLTSSGYHFALWRMSEQYLEIPFLPHRKHNTYFRSFCWHVLCTNFIFMYREWSDGPIRSVYLFYNMINVTHAVIKNVYKQRSINVALLLTLNYTVSVGVKKMYAALHQTGDTGTTNSNAVM